MIDLKQYELWFVTGSQHLYGPQILEQVAEHAREIAGALGASAHMPVNVVFKPVLTTPESIRALCLEANSAGSCIGLITWMHTFSPAKMWIAGLTLLKKPFFHLHTQYNREIPWGEIDMDFMNLNQSAHGDREFGFIGSRLRLERKVVVGHWQDEEVQIQQGAWARAAAAWIYAGGAHHTSFSFAVTAEQLCDFAAMAGVEYLLIDEHTRVEDFKDRLRWNDLYYHLNKGL